MTPVEVVLAVAALAIGLTGAWSPCGFSMVETIGLAGDRGRRLTATAACTAFVPGAVVGGVATFGLLSVLGELVHGAAGRTAYLVAAGVAVAAAGAEARGLRIAPQIRRQLPERWRWTMPLPLAAGLYGVLLGLGFTTFVLTFGVWALGGISLALGNPKAGLVIGAAFGIGRAIPVVVLAPAVDRPFAQACIRAMAERPALYRLLRLGDAVTLGLVAAVLATTTASAERTEVSNGADPSVVGKALAFQKENRTGVLRFEGRTRSLPGSDPALGGQLAAVISGSRIQILNRLTLDVVGTAPAFHPEAVAVSPAWLAYLTRYHGHYALKVRSVSRLGNPGKARKVAEASSPAVIGRPSIAKGRVAFTVSKRRSNTIRLVGLKSGKRRTLLRSRRAQLLSPSLLGRRLLYVKVSRGSQGPLASAPRALHQALMLRRVAGHGRGHRIYGRRGLDRRLWSTSLGPKRAYLTLLGGDGPRIVSVKR
jgi:hypothetical protein